jgi:lipid-A-disaccharide synthase
MIIALVAGEASGDQLGAELIRAIRQREPTARFEGIGGPLMEAAGMDTWWYSDQLAVMGLFEVARHIPRLFALRRQLVKRLLARRPDVFIGIDAPDFNLGVEQRLKAASIPVMHYVSPTVWAWRPGRVKTIAKSTDRVMCLFPFEPGYYESEAVEADYTGHPMADEIPLTADVEQARERLGVKGSGPFIALLPGSRLAEVGKLAEPMFDGAKKLTGRYPDAVFLVPAATEVIKAELERESGKHPGLDCHVFSGRSKDVMTAADVVVCASGTATLEVMLVNRPMVVCYRLSEMTYRFGKWLNLMKSPYFALPNILASEKLVPELLQDEVSGRRIADEVATWLDDRDNRTTLRGRFDHIHRQLKIGAADTAADVVLTFIRKGPEQVSRQ